MILGALETGPASLQLLRELRAGALDARGWPEVPVITLAPLAGRPDSTRCAPTRPAATTPAAQRRLPASALRRGHWCAVRAA